MEWRRKEQQKYLNPAARPHEEKYAGEKTINKIKKIQYKIKQAQMDNHL
jgi:hypothetical protein